MMRPLTYHKFLKKAKGYKSITPAPIILLFLLSKKDQINKNLFKISGSLIKQSSLSTKLFPIPILYWLKYRQKAQYYSVLDLKDAFFCIPLHPDNQPPFVFKGPTNHSQWRASQFVVLLKQHIKLGSAWLPLFAPTNVPIWALYNKCSLQIHISASPVNEIPALSQGILTTSYA
jgi:hypothetical protein